MGLVCVGIVVAVVTCSHVMEVLVPVAAAERERERARQRESEGRNEARERPRERDILRTVEGVGLRAQGLSPDP